MFPFQIQPETTNNTEALIHGLSTFIQVYNTDTNSQDAESSCKRSSLYREEGDIKKNTSLVLSGCNF